MSVQRAVSHTNPTTSAAVCALFFAVDRRPRLPHDAPPFDVLYGRANDASAFQKAITGGPSGYYIFAWSTVVEVKTLIEIKSVEKPGFATNNVNPRTGSRVSSSKSTHAGRSGPASDISMISSLCLSVFGEVITISRGGARPLHVTHTHTHK